MGGRVAFSLDAGTWHPWPGLAAEVEPLTSLPPATAVRSTGLPRGERALVAAATARALGCRALAAAEARRAVEALKRRREVLVVLEEGLPSPLTGRLGAIVTAAGAIARSPAILGGRELWRLAEEKLDDQEVADLILTAAVTSWTARNTLGLGRPAHEGAPA